MKSKKVKCELCGKSYTAYLWKAGYCSECFEKLENAFLKSYKIALRKLKRKLKDRK